MYNLLLTIFAACNFHQQNPKQQVECRKALIECTEITYNGSKGAVGRDNLQNALVKCVKRMDYTSGK